MESNEVSMQAPEPSQEAVELGKNHVHDVDNDDEENQHHIMLPNDEEDDDNATTSPPNNDVQPSSLRLITDEKTLSLSLNVIRFGVSYLCDHEYWKQAACS